MDTRIPQFATRSRLGLGVAAIVAAIWGCQPTLPAADLYWSGTGTWNTTDAVWGTSSSGPYDAAIWSNATPDSAIFEGTAGTVTLGGPITAGGLTFAVDGYTVTGNTLTLSGTTTVSAGTATIDSRVAGSTGLTKAGDGTLVLSAANTYTGGTTINGGTVRLSTNSNGVGSGAITLGAGGTIEYAATTGNYQPTNVITGSGTFLKNGAAVLYLSGTTNLVNAGVAYVLNGGTVLLGGNGIAGWTAQFGSLAGNATLTPAWQGTGAFVIETGARNESTTFSGTILNAYPGDAVAKTVALKKVGTGTLTLGALNTFTGGTIVEAGTLQLNVGGLSGTIRGSLDVQSGATVLANASNALGFSGAGRVSNLTLTGGTLTVAASGDQAVWGATVTMTGGTINLTNAGARLALGGDSLTGDAPTTFTTLGSETSATISGVAGSIVNLQNSATAGGAVTFTIADGAAADDLLVSVPIGNTSRLVKEGPGTMRATSGSNSFSGGLTVNGGTFAAASLGSGPLVVNAGARVSWTNSSYASFSVSAITLNGGVLSLDGTTQNAHNFIATPITLSGGTLTSVNGPAGPANDGGFGNFILNGSTLVVSGAAQSLISTTTLQTNGANASFNVGETGQDVDLRVTAAVQGAGTLRKSGLGTMDLTRGNSYSGGTVVNAGILKLTATGAAGSGLITINGGTVEIATNAFNVLSSSVNPVTIGAGGTLLANNTSDNAHNLGALTLNGGTLASNGVTSGFGNFALRNVTTGGSARSTIESTSIAIAAGANTFTVNDAVAGTDLLVSAAVLASGTSGIAKAGAGTMELTGTNTYTGGTTISAGTLIAGNASALGTAGVSIAAGGTLLTPAGVSVSNTRTLAGGSLGFTSNAAAGTLASLLAGSAGASQVLAPTTAWASGTANVTYSDVLTLTNTSSIPQVLTMRFNPSGLAQGLIDSLELGWFDPGTSDWVSAIDGNSGGTATFFSGSWAEYLVATPSATPANSLGVYGRDTGGNNAWAVINHNSDFAVIAVPEPTTGMMVVAAGVAAALLRRRARAP